MKKINMPLSDSYDIIIENNALDKLNSYIKEVYNGKNIYLISDVRVASFYLNKVMSNLTDFNVKTVIIEGYEKAKNIRTYEDIIKQLLDYEISRNELIIGLGGGVIGDIASFIASTIYRGINYIAVPTSLLAQVDSSIGGKTGIDFLNYKNIIGSFFQPNLVVIDPLTLKTLPKEEVVSGLGEIIKHGMIYDKTLIDDVKNKLGYEEIIHKSLLVKKHFVIDDEFDQANRMILNFGHTFGHAIELKYNLSHGLAVINGMLLAIKYGIDLGITNPNVLKYYQTLLCSLNIECLEIDYNNLLSDLKYDKKNFSGILKFIFIKDIGHSLIKEINIK